jgi:lipoprotein NlpD
MRGITAAILAFTLAGCIPHGAVPEPAPQASLPPSQTYERAALAPEVTQLPAPPKAWEARPVTPDARTVPASSYVIAAGDTLRSIAEKTGASSEAIARENALAPPYVIRPGQRLRIPAGRYHLVRAGQSGIAIARAYAVDWSRVVTANALTEPYILRTGQRVLIPGTAAQVAVQSPAERAAAFRLDIDDLVTGSEPALAQNAKPSRPTATPRKPLPSTAALLPPSRSPGAFVWPVRGQLLRRFGPGQSGERNDGIKIAVPSGTPVLAAGDGVVAYVGSDIPALGGLVIIKHGASLASVYGHLSRLSVQRGQAVKRGQAIALSGSSGFAERSQLHFEIRQGRVPLDPLTRLPAL